MSSISKILERKRGFAGSLLTSDMPTADMEGFILWFMTL